MNPPIGYCRLNLKPDNFRLRKIDHIRFPHQGRRGAFALQSEAVADLNLVARA